MAFQYPQPGYHFLVTFELPLQSPNDVRFQQVDGLTVTAQYEAVREGGENRFLHQLPQQLEFTEVVLKRGKFLGSGVLQWARQGLENFDFQPVNVMISLLDSNHAPLYNWYLVNAVPKSLAVGGINAMTNEIVVETLALNYQYFRYFDPASLAMDAAAGLSAGVNI